MEQIKFSVKQYGKVLNPNLYSFRSDFKDGVEKHYFHSLEWNLQLDFSGIDNVTFSTEICSSIKAGKNCVFYNSAVGRFDLIPDSLNVGIDYRSGWKIVSCLGGIYTNVYPIHWWKNKLDVTINEVGCQTHSLNYWNVTMIKVGCQTHSLNYWKEYYKEIAKQNNFPEKMIPEYLNHLRTIESSLTA